MKAIVSCLFGNYDRVHNAPKFNGWDCYLFTDQQINPKKGWKAISIKSNDPKKDSRYYKWMTHKTLPKYKKILYLDANMQMIRTPPEQEIWFYHPIRTTVREEARRIMKYERDCYKKVLKQWKHYKETNFNDDKGLYQNGFFLRPHNTKTNEFCEQIYDLTKRFSYRDQLATPYALFKTGYQMKNIRNGNISRHYVNLFPHNKTK